MKPIITIIFALTVFFTYSSAEEDTTISKEKIIVAHTNPASTEQNISLDPVPIATKVRLQLHLKNASPKDIRIKFTNSCPCLLTDVGELTVTRASASETGVSFITPASSGDFKEAIRFRCTDVDSISWDYTIWVHGKTYSYLLPDDSGGVIDTGAIRTRILNHSEEIFHFEVTRDPLSTNWENISTVINGDDFSSAITKGEKTDSWIVAISAGPRLLNSLAIGRFTSRIDFFFSGGSGIVNPQPLSKIITVRFVDKSILPGNFLDFGNVPRGHSDTKTIKISSSMIIDDVSIPNHTELSSVAEMTSDFNIIRLTLNNNALDSNSLSRSTGGPLRIIGQINNVRTVVNVPISWRCPAN